MKDFSYLQPETLEEASQSLENSFEESLPYAGGTDLLGMMKNDLSTPDKVVNLKSIPGLTEIKYIPGKGLSIGALVRVAQITQDKTIQEKFTVLAQAAQKVASPQLRNMGTIGGNLCQRPRCWYFRGDFHCLRKGGDMCYAVDGENKYHCIIGGGPCFIVHPSDTAVALLALDASLKIFNGKQSREIPLSEFFVLPDQNILRENILEPGELITEILVPETAGNTTSQYIKFIERGAWDFALVSVAAVIRNSGKQIQSGRIAFGGVAPVPWLEKEVSNRLSGFTVNKQNLKQISEMALKKATPLEHNGYKLILARNLLKRVLINLTSA
jgi:xanthine dehydrogenase YagS FAD-binding subunit